MGWSLRPWAYSGAHFSQWPCGMGWRTPSGVRFQHVLPASQTLRSAAAELFTSSLGEGGQNLREVFPSPWGRGRPDFCRDG
jgi:hypothetical protein